MRFARKLGLLAVMAIAAMAVTAPSAFAQIGGEGDLEFRIEQPGGGRHCGALTVMPHIIIDGCAVNSTSTGSIVMRRHVFGIESTVSTCTTTFTARLNEDGAGYLTNQVLAGASCARRPCSEEPPLESKPWFLLAHERPYMHGTGVGEQNWTEVLHLDYCVEAIDNAHTAENCEVVVPFRHVGGHKYEFGIQPTATEEMPGIGPDGFRCELRGHWTTNGASSGVEVVHI